MRGRGEHGSVMMETVLVMPILFVLIMGVLQLAQIWTARQIVKYAAYCAARATLTSNEYTAYYHARAAARQVCAWIAFADKAEDFKESQNTSPLWWNSDGFSVGDAQMFVYSLARSSVGNGNGNGVEIPGWGRIPNSGSVDRRLRVSAGIIEPYNQLYPWETRAIVEFDFPLLMPVVGNMLSYLAQTKPDELYSKLDSGEVGFKVGSGWTGQRRILDSEKGAEKHAFPYITLRETCILPKPYSTAVYPCTTKDLELSLSGVFQ